MSVRPRIVCVGDILADIVLRGGQPESSDAGYEYRQLLGIYAGGAAVNAAVAARRAGADAVVLGVLGDGPYAQVVRNRLAAEGICLIAGSSSLPTGVVVTFVEPGGHRSVVGRGAADGLYLQADELSLLMRPGDLLHLNVFNIRFGDHRDNNIKALREFALSRRDCRLSLDLNGADSSALPILESLPHLDVLFGTATEIDSIFGKGVGSERIMRLAATVAVKRGARGMTLLCRGESLDIPAPVVQVKDTLGAGDCLAGTYLALVGAGADPSVAAQEAVERASSSVTRHGPWEPR